MVGYKNLLRLFHAAQRELFMELSGAGLLPVNRQRLAQVRDLADTILNQVAAEYEENLAPAIPRVWSSEVEEIRADLHGWLGQLASADDGWSPMHFELGFVAEDDAEMTVGAAVVLARIVRTLCRQLERQAA